MRKALTHLRKTDPVMRLIIRTVGPYSIEYSPAEFSTVVRCIVYQQLSGKAALTIYKRLAVAAGAAMDDTTGRRSGTADGGVSPESVLAVSAEQMRELGLSRQKIVYIRELAAGCVGGEIYLEKLCGMSDAEVMRTLTARKGIGPWTVHMYQIFALARLDVLPVGDLGIRVAMQRAYDLDVLPKPAAMERLAEPWRPYATVACWYLWRSLGDGAGLDPVVD